MLTSFVYAFQRLILHCFSFFRRGKFRFISTNQCSKEKAFVLPIMVSKVHNGLLAKWSTQVSVYPSQPNSVKHPSQLFSSFLSFFFFFFLLSMSVLQNNCMSYYYYCYNYIFLMFGSGCLQALLIYETFRRASCNKFTCRMGKTW